MLKFIETIFEDIILAFFFILIILGCIIATALLLPFILVGLIVNLFTN